LKIFHPSENLNRGVGKVRYSKLRFFEFWRGDYKGDESSKELSEIYTNIYLERFCFTVDWTTKDMYIRFKLYCST